MMGLESALVQEILTIAEGIISENRVLNAKLLFKEVCKQLKIDHKSLLAIINSLLAQRILVEGSKLTKELILSNMHRKNIYEYIRKNRGANFSTIRQEYEGTTGSSGQLIWHLQVLMQFNYIKKIKYKRFTIFLPLELEDEEGLLTFLLRDPLNKKILRLLHTHGILNKTDFYQDLDAPREKIHYHLNTLLEVNLISSIGDKEVCINPGKKGYLDEILKKPNENGGKKYNGTELDS